MKFIKISFVALLSLMLVSACNSKKQSDYVAEINTARATIDSLFNLDIVDTLLIQQTLTKQAFYTQAFAADTVNSQKFIEQAIYAHIAIDEPHKANALIDTFVNRFPTHEHIVPLLLHARGKMIYGHLLRNTSKESETYNYILMRYPNHALISEVLNQMRFIGYY